MNNDYDDNDVDVVACFVQRIATAMTIIVMMITMTLTMLLPVAAVFLLLVRHSHYKSLAFCGLSKQQLQKMKARMKQKHNENHGMCNSSQKNTRKPIKKKQKTNSLNKHAKHPLIHENHTQNSRPSGS